MLIKDGLAHITKDVPVVLEATTWRSRDLYLRLGFQVRRRTH